MSFDRDLSVFVMANVYVSTFDISGEDNSNNVYFNVDVDYLLESSASDWTFEDC